MQPPPPPNWRELASLLARFLPWGLKRKGHNSFFVIWNCVEEKSMSYWFFNSTFVTPRAPCNSLTRLEARAGGRLERWGSFTTRSSQVDILIFWKDQDHIQVITFSHIISRLVDHKIRSHSQRRNCSWKTQEARLAHHQVFAGWHFDILHRSSVS